jgi:hypothetical protein
MEAKNRPVIGARAMTSPGQTSQRKDERSRAQTRSQAERIGGTRRSQTTEGGVARWNQKLQGDRQGSDLASVKAPMGRSRLGADNSAKVTWVMVGPVLWDSGRRAPATSSFMPPAESVHGAPPTWAATTYSVPQADPGQPGAERFPELQARLISLTAGAKRGSPGVLLYGRTGAPGAEVPSIERIPGSVCTGDAGRRPRHKSRRHPLTRHVLTLHLVTRHLVIHRLVIWHLFI